MAKGTISGSASVAGVNIPFSIERMGNGVWGLDPTSEPAALLPAAVAGSLTLWTSNTVGSVTAAGHGLTTADKANIFWGGATPGCRYGVTVGTVAGDVVPFTAGAGDNLPAEDTAVTIAEVVVIDCADLDGDKVQIFAVVCDKRAHIAFMDVDEAVVGTTTGQSDLSANEPWYWAKESGPANPLSGNPFTHIHASCGAAAVGNLRAGMIYST